MKDIIEYGNKVCEQLTNDKNSRYKSWEYCYKSFQDAYKSKNIKKPDYDYLSLQLSFYLASWGMYRGSSFLLWKDYKVHESIVKLLFKYDSLWNIKIDNNHNQNLNAFYSDLIKLRNEMRDKYSEIRKEVYELNKELGSQPKTKISDTLISKIILGTIGCIPAYDRYFVSGVKMTNTISGSLSSDSIKELVKYYKNNYKELENLRNKFSINSDVEYSQMKVLDSCFWQYGFELEDK